MARQEFLACYFCILHSFCTQNGKITSRNWSAKCKNNEQNLECKCENTEIGAQNAKISNRIWSANVKITPRNSVQFAHGLRPMPAHRGWSRAPENVTKRTTSKTTLFRFHWWATLDAMTSPTVIHYLLAHSTISSLLDLYHLEISTSTPKAHISKPRIKHKSPQTLSSQIF